MADQTTSPTTLSPGQQTAKLQELQTKWAMLAAEVGQAFDLQGQALVGPGRPLNFAMGFLDKVTGVTENPSYLTPTSGRPAKEIALQAQALLDQAQRFGIDRSQLTAQGPIDGGTANTRLAEAIRAFTADPATQAGIRDPTKAVATKALIPTTTFATGASAQAAADATAGRIPAATTGPPAPAAPAKGSSPSTTAPAAPSGGAAAPPPGSTSTVTPFSQSAASTGTAGAWTGSSADIAYLTRVHGANTAPSFLFGSDMVDASGNPQPNADIPNSVAWSPYRTGDLTSTPDIGGGPTNYTFREALALPYGWNQDQLQAAAEKLWRAGFLDAGSIDPTKPFAQQFHADAYDPKFEDAYFHLMQASWATPGKTMTEILDQRATERAPFIQSQITDVVNQRMAAFNWTNPARVAEATTGAYQTLTGMNPDAGRIQAEQEQIKVEDQARFKTALSTGQAGQAPDVASEAAQAVRAEHPEEVFGKAAADEIGLFRQLVGGQW